MLVVADRPKHQEQKDALERFERERESLEADIRAREDHVARMGGHGGPHTAALNRKRARLAELDRHIDRLWSICHPAYVEGVGLVGALPPKCRVGSCGVLIEDERRRFEQLGFCDDCFKIATGQAPVRSTTSTSEDSYVEWLVS